MIVLNGDLINQVFPAYDKKSGKPALNCIHIKDVDNQRVYVATDGHILFKVWENIPDESEKLKNPINLIIQKKLKLNKQINPYFSLELISYRGILTGGLDIASCEISDFDYPDVDRVIPKERKILDKWIPFDIDYLKKVRDFLNERLCLPAPFAEDITAPAIWEKENGLACLMPCRL